jgi:hypothetical protein
MIFSYPTSINIKSHHLICLIEPLANRNLSKYCSDMGQSGHIISGVDVLSHSPSVKTKGGPASAHASGWSTATGPTANPTVVMLFSKIQTVLLGAVMQIVLTSHNGG